jgi:Big-like domain-containing protein
MIDISSDFVTFFFREGEAEGRSVSLVNGDMLITAYVNGVDWDEQDLDGSLQKLGGVKVIINTAKNSARISTEKTQKYRGPRKMLCLQIDQAPKLIEIGNFNFRAGDHLVVPVDEQSEQALDDLRRTLEYLPSDYEISIMNFLRRPSLEMRIARLEQISGAGAGRNTYAARNLKQGRSKQKFWIPQSWANALKWAWPVIFALLFLVLGYLIGQVTPDFLKSWLLPDAQETKSDGGDTKHRSGTSGSSETKTGRKTPVVSVEPSSTEAAYGDPIEFRVTVGHGADSSDTPSGKVQLEKAGQGQSITIFGDPVALDATGRAVLTNKKLPVGTQKILIAYLGDQAFAQTNSEKLDLNIKKISTTTTLKVNKKENQVVLSAKVVCGALKPIGKVDFYNNRQPFYTVDFENGVAETTQNLPAGPNSFSAAYQGNSYCDGSKSERVSVK